MSTDDIEVQEVFEGQTSLQLPKAKFKLPSSSPQPMSPMRSLTPCDGVPRPAFLRCVSDVNDVYKLRRPSSHYDAQAQAASSRPTSRQDLSCQSPLAPPPPPLFDYSAFARAKAFQELTEEESNWFEDLETCEGGSSDNIIDSRIQRPESMIIPIGGVWRPDDEPVEQFFLDQPTGATATAAAAQSNSTTQQQSTANTQSTSENDTSKESYNLY